MNADALGSIISRLPENERESAKAMIAVAEIAGITQIGFWKWLNQQKYSRFDLAGIDPQGRLRFLLEIS